MKKEVMTELTRQRHVGRELYEKESKGCQGSRKDKCMDYESAVRDVN
jgi:hypothetical protein